MWRRFTVRAVLIVVAYLVFVVVVFVTGMETRTLAAFLAGLVVARLGPRVWRWADGEAYARTQKAAPPPVPKER